MKTIDRFQDLEQFGIKALTGEACRVGRRALYDLTDQGAKIVADLLGLRGHFPGVFQENWNSGGSYSVMLPYSLWTDLAIWCLIHTGCTEIIEVDGEVYGREPADTPEEWGGFLDHMRKYHDRVRVIALKNQPGQGTRCTHAMTGRTE